MIPLRHTLPLRTPPLVALPIDRPRPCRNALSATLMFSLAEPVFEPGDE